MKKNDCSVWCYVSFYVVGFWLKGLSKNCTSFVQIKPRSGQLISNSMLGSSLNTWNSVGFIHLDVWSVHKERNMKMGFLHIVVVVIGELVLDPFEAVPQGWFELTFHGVHVVGCHPLSPLHLWIIGCCKLVHLAYWTIKAVWVGA